MYFDRHFLENLRRRISISEIVGESVNLKPKGRGEFTGLCPFHSEKTPSFTVSEAKGFYHCFGCGAHGDAFRFLTEQRGISYPEAVKELALQAGMELPKQDVATQAKQKKLDDSLELMEHATKWFEQNLKSNKGQQALSYLKGRGLTDKTIKQFRIGFVSDEWEGLKNHLKSLGAEEDLLKANGLISSNESGTKTYDRFRNRIIFPIFDSRNNPIAFGGRIITDDKNAPKYLNSPETDLFKKGYILYGYNFARDEAYKKSQIIAVEGYMDVIALHQAGFKNTVAPLGTAVTENHIKQLWRICDEPIFCLDGDNAGVRAMMRLAENYIYMLEPGKTMKFVILPNKQDPDDVIKSEGASGFNKLLNDSQNLSDALWNINIQGESLTTPEKKSAFSEKMLQIVSKIQNASVRNFYIQDYKNRIFKLGMFYYKNKSETVSHRSSTITNTPKLERITEKILLLACFNPLIVENSEIEEFLQNIEISNKNLEKLAFLLIDYIALGDEEGANYKGFKLHLENHSETGQIEYLERTPLKAEYCNKIDDVAKAVTAWQYLLSEYDLTLAENEFKKLSHNGSSDVDKVYLAKDEVMKLESRRDYKRKQFEEIIDNELI